MNRSAILLAPLIGIGNASAVDVLVFSKTSGFRHSSITDGIALINRLATAHGFEADFSEEASDFTDANLAQYDAVIFLSTTGDILNGAEEDAFERYMQAGGGWVGVHAAADTEYDWPWYNGLLGGAHFQNHPSQQTATINVEDNTHPATAHLSATWTRRDEWYNYRANPRTNVTVLLTLDESTYNGGSMGADHPIAWYHEYDGGRAFYTGLGHTSASFTEPEFEQHLLGGILYAAGSSTGEPTRHTNLLVPAGSTWAFWDRGEDLGTAWRAREFDDRVWPSGPSKLGNGDGNEVTPVNIGPSDDRHPTIYFRHRFSIGELPELITSMSIRLLRDDGGVVYLNGTEIGRSNLEAGPVSYGSFAENSVGNANENTFFAIDASDFAEHLRVGENVLAVEIHQSGSGSSDLGFDLSLEIESVIPPKVRIEENGEQFVISWPEVYTTAYGAVLQRSETLRPGAAVWESAPGTPTASEGILTQLISPTEGESYFRLLYQFPPP